MRKQDLSDKPGTFLMCEGAGPEHETFSATPGDYFWMADSDEFTCQECGAPMSEYTSKRVYEPVSSEATR